MVEKENLLRRIDKDSDQLIGREAGEKKQRDTKKVLQADREAGKPHSREVKVIICFFFFVPGRGPPVVFPKLQDWFLPT